MQLHMTRNICTQWCCVAAVAAADVTASASTFASGYCSTGDASIGTSKSVEPAAGATTTENGRH
jgi:hypothetical protein